MTSEQPNGMELAKELRIEIGAEILISMAANDEFPVANSIRLGKTMQEYFVTEGFEDWLVERGYKWRPSADYWTRHHGESRKYLRERDKGKMFCQFVRDEGGVTGSWQFSRKGDYERVMAERRNEIETRIGNYNEEIEAGAENRRWPKLHAARISHEILQIEGGEG